MTPEPLQPFSPGKACVLSVQMWQLLALFQNSLRSACGLDLTLSALRQVLHGCLGGYGASGPARIKFHVLTAEVSVLS